MTNVNGQVMDTSAPLPIVRQTVRELLLSSPAYHDLPAEQQKEMASLMVRVCDTAARLVQEEIASAANVETVLAHQAGADPHEVDISDRLLLATELAAGDDFSGIAASRIAGTTRRILNAVSFPAFVTDLINGVFKSITNSNLAQMQNYIELLNNVAASTEGFADLNYGPDRARRWLVDQFPASYMLEGEEEEDDTWDDGGWGSDDTFGAEERRVALRPGARRPSDSALRAALGLPDDAQVPSGSPDTALVPLVRQRLARTRQETLATLVRLGMQRLVIDAGRINASMRFHIDTRSAARADEGRTFDARHQSSGSGSYGFGPWGVSASIQNNIGYVSTSESQTTEEMNVDLDLNSSVELVFRTDQVPLNRLANAEQTAKILGNTRNPEAEARLYQKERETRRAAQQKDEQGRRARTGKAIQPKPLKPKKAGEPGTVDAARKAREQAGQKQGGKQQTTGAKQTDGTGGTKGKKTQGTAQPSRKSGDQKRTPAEKPAGTNPTTARTRSGTGQQQGLSDTGGPATTAMSSDHPTEDDAPFISPETPYKRTPANENLSRRTLSQELAQGNTVKGEQLIYTRTSLHNDPPNRLINLPEPGNGQDLHEFEIPDGLRFSRWEVEVIELSTGAGYAVNNPPEAGVTGRQMIQIDWSHLPYGTVHYRLSVYASTDGRPSTARIVLDQEHWLSQAKDQVAQGVPIDVVIQGPKAKLLYEAIRERQADTGQGTMTEAFYAPGTETAVIVAITSISIALVLSLVVVIGMVTFALLLRDAMEKGYDIADTKYTVKTGEGESRQEHEMVFNLSRPQHGSG